MAHTLPPLSHPARELFAVADLAAVGTGSVPVLAGLHRARKAALRLLDAMPAARRVALFHVRAEDDMLELVSVGRKGGIRREWVFGPVTRQMVLA